MQGKQSKAAALADVIEDGSSLALAPDYSGCALAVIRELIRRGAKDLHLVGCPQLGLQADLLIAKGCVRSIETAAIGLGELGLAPAFDRAYRRSELSVLEATCPAIHSGLQAAEKGVGFLPIAGIIGSDLVDARQDWSVIDDPFSGEPVLLVPAIRPDVALFHAPLGDADKNVWVGIRRELILMAHAARRTLVSVEAKEAENLLKDETKAAGTLPGIYVEDMRTVPDGARPQGLFGRYSADTAFLKAYVEAGRDEVRHLQFIDRWAGL